MGEDWFLIGYFFPLEIATEHGQINLLQSNVTVVFLSGITCCIIILKSGGWTI